MNRNWIKFVHLGKLKQIHTYKKRRLELISREKEKTSQTGLFIT